MTIARRLHARIPTTGSVDSVISSVDFRLLFHRKPARIGKLPEKIGRLSVDSELGQSTKIGRLSGKIGRLSVD